MSDSYNNNFLVLQKAVNEEKDLLASLYSPTDCRSVQQLQQLMDKELGELIKIKIKINQLSKEAIYEEMRLNGIEYPSIVWAEEIAPKIPDFNLHSLHQQAPVADSSDRIPDEKCAKKPLNCKRAVIYAVTATGVVLTITGLTLTPVNRVLLGMGIVMTATGVVLLVKEFYFDKKDLAARKPSLTTGANAGVNNGQIADLLKKNLEYNVDIITDWNKKLCDITVEAIHKTKEK